MFGMATVIAITNQKGGVGKTTTTVVNLAAGFAAKGAARAAGRSRPAGQRHHGLRHRQAKLPAGGLYRLLLGEATLGGGALPLGKWRFDVLPANRELGGAEVELVGPRREQRLKDALAEVRADYDLILLDCPPALNLLTLNGLAAASRVIIPMQCEYYALEGLSDLVNTLKKARASLNPGIEMLGLLRTMYDPRFTLSQQVSAQLQQYFPGKLFETAIPRNVCGWRKRPATACRRWRMIAPRAGQSVSGAGGRNRPAPASHPSQAGGIKSWPNPKDWARAGCPARGQS